MNGRLRNWILGFGILLALVVAAESRGVSIEELRKEIEAKNEEIKKLEEEAKRYRDEIVAKQGTGKTLTEELKRISRQIEELRRQIVLIERRIKKAELEIGALDIEIGEKEDSMEKLRKGLGALLQTSREQESRPLLEILAAHPLLSDFFQELEYAALIQQRILHSLDTLRNLRQELTTNRAEAQGKRDELKELRGELRDQRRIQENVRRERNDLLKVTQNQEKRYQELLRETERKQEAILREIEELEEELRKRVDPTSLPARRIGFLLWPAEGRVSQGYGETPFTRSRRGQHFYKFHNGIDIVTPTGAPILAADDGVVRATGDTDRYCWRGAYGKYIVVDHENNLATMYAHLSFIRVEAGARVRKGDIIGYAGSSGLSTGPHLHFTLYDARTVEVRPGRLGTCGPLPLGGSLNPLLYL